MAEAKEQAKMLNSLDVMEYMEDNGCSDQEARKALMAKM